jgi:hypothetical protein
MDGAEERILIRVLHVGSLLQDPPVTWANDAPLVTVANRSTPMACGLKVDQARPLAGAAARRIGDLCLIRPPPTTPTSKPRRQPPC